MLFEFIALQNVVNFTCYKKVFTKMVFKITLHSDV